MPATVDASWSGRRLAAVRARGAGVMPPAKLAAGSSIAPVSAAAAAVACASRREALAARGQVRGVERQGRAAAAVGKIRR
jgi:hypothetical protein